MRFIRIAVALAIALGGVPLTFAQESEVTVSNKSFGDWSVRCQKPKGGKESCVMSQTASVQESGQRLLQVNVGKNPNLKSTANMTLVAPLGIHLPSGLSMAIDGGEEKIFEISFCNQSGCYVNQVLDKPLQLKIGSAKAISITVHSLDKQPIEIPISAKGFKKALKAIL